MSVVRLSVVDHHNGDADAAIRAFCTANAVCRKLADRGFEFDLVPATGRSSSPDLVVFLPWGEAKTAEKYPDAVRIFWCFENHHYFPEFASYRRYREQYDFAFTFDPTDDKNFRILAAMFD